MCPLYVLHTMRLCALRGSRIFCKGAVVHVHVYLCVYGCVGTGGMFSDDKTNDEGTSTNKRRWWFSLSMEETGPRLSGLPGWWYSINALVNMYASILVVCVTTWKHVPYMRLAFPP